MKRFWAPIAPAAVIQVKEGNGLSELRGTWMGGFSWGYTGGGPHRTAEAILTSVFDGETAHDLSHLFVVEVLAMIRADGPLSITEDRIRQWALDRTTSVRRIPARVKKAVWTRDEGKCVNCGSMKDLQYDHVIPYSKGGSSSDSKNIQLLCARCNLKKRARIE